ncbi:MAG: HPr family phosphocarrier protein [Kiritimatiellia bacterium]
MSNPDPECKDVREVVLQTEYGLHVRPASVFAKVASRFNADVYVEMDGTVVSGKSIMALMTLGAVHGARLLISAEGDQSQEALDELENLVKRNFDIPEKKE